MYLHAHIIKGEINGLRTDVIRKLTVPRAIIKKIKFHGTRWARPLCKIITITTML